MSKKSFSSLFTFFIVSERNPLPSSRLSLLPIGTFFHTFLLRLLHFEYGAGGGIFEFIIEMGKLKEEGLSFPLFRRGRSYFLESVAFHNYKTMPSAAVVLTSLPK